MKRSRLLLCILCLCLLLTACGRQNVQIDYGESHLYSDDEISAAVQVILTEFNSWRGCLLYSLTYQGDEACNAENLAYCNDLGDGQEFTECIFFDSTFRSPLRGGGAWNANCTYEWSWCLAREDGGDWVLLTWGVC